MVPRDVANISDSVIGVDCKNSKLGFKEKTVTPTSAAKLPRLKSFIIFQIKIPLTTKEAIDTALPDNPVLNIKSFQIVRSSKICCRGSQTEPICATPGCKLSTTLRATSKWDLASL